MSAYRDKIRCDVVQVDALAESDKLKWLELCAGHSAYVSPLLHPCFTQIVAAHRKDVRLALYRRGEELVGLFAFHLRPGRFARPVGAPFADFSGPILARDSGLTPARLLELAGLRSFKFDGLSDPWRVFDGLGLQRHEAHQIDLADIGADDYLEACRAKFSKRFKNFRRLISQLEREGVTLDLYGGVPTDEDFKQLLAWKSAQFQSTGRLDLIGKLQTMNVLRQAKGYKSEDVEGYMVRLVANGELVAGHFGIRSHTHYHPWIAAYRPDFAPHSPGSLLLYKAIAKMPDLDLQTYELAGGHEHYKKYFARTAQDTLSGFIRLSGQGALITDRASLIGIEDGSVGARLRRRLDHIAVCDTRTPNRIKDFASAILTARVSRPSSHGR